MMSWYQELSQNYFSSRLDWDQHLIFFFGTALVPIATFWLGVAIYTLFDKYKLFAQNKIQPNRYAPQKLVKKAARQILSHQVFILLPMLFFTYPLFALFGMNFSWDQWPAWWAILLQIIFFMFVEDFLFYWSHRAFHRPSLYKKIHRRHHEFVTPSAIAALYAHPLEFIIANSIPSIAGPLILCAIGVPVHVGVLWAWLFIRIVETLDGHSGYDFRLWFPHKLIYGAGSRAHDDHHSKFNGNFASFFSHWDTIHGSTLPVKPKKKVMKDEEETSLTKTKSNLA